MLEGPPRGPPSAEDWKVRPRGQGCDVTHRAINDDTGYALATSGPGQQLADHRVIRPASGGDHDDLTRARHGNGVVNRPMSAGCTGR